MSQLSNQEMDISYSQGLLEGVLENAPAPVKDALEKLVGGIEFYKQKQTAVEQDYNNLLAKYNSLTGTAAGYLQIMQQQKEQIDELLIDQQRPYHAQE